jgi:hypothetical protein
VQVLSIVMGSVENGSAEHEHASGTSPGSGSSSNDA